SCFLQAEDGIRDRNVTGVQTCALPISTTSHTPVRCALNPSRPTTRPSPSPPRSGDPWSAPRMRSPPTTWRTCGPSRTADPVSALPGGEDVRLGKRQPHRPLLQVQQQHLVVTLTHQWRRDIQGLLGADVPV